MRIELRDTRRRRLGRVEVDVAARPTRAPVAGSDREVFLHWETALDDAGNLRRCVVCDCPALFFEKAFPQITGFIVVLAFAGAVAGVLGFARNPGVLVGMAVVLALDVAILIFSRRRLVCYRCRTSFHGMSIARYHKAWDRTLADKYVPQEDADETNGAQRASVAG